MLGDILTSTIIADQLKMEHPDCEIHYLVKSSAAAILKNHPSIDRLVLVEGKDFNSYYRLRKLAIKIRSEKFDVLIDVYGKNNSAILSGLSRIPVRVGYSKWFSSLAYTTHLKNNPEAYNYEKGSSIVSRLLLTIPFTQKVDWTLRPKIFLDYEEKDQGLSWLKKNGLNPAEPLTMVSVLGSSPIKTLPDNYLAELLDRYVRSCNSRLLFNYIPAQKTKAKKIYDLCDPETRNRIYIDAFAPSIRDFLKILYHCDAVIGNEGGAINMGKALDVPSFAIFSPWIEKNAWNNDEDGSKHIAIHLIDVKPNLIQQRPISQLKRQSLKLYQEFRPEMIWPELKKFIEKNSLSD